MVSSILKQAAEILNKRKKNKRWMQVFLSLAVVVVLGTLAMLKLTGQAMTHKEKVLNCQFTSEADYVVHIHNDDCYDKEGNLVCSLEELKEHTHEDACYEEQEVLSCGQEIGAGGHEHTEACYEVSEQLICGQEESAEHTHVPECYERSETLICGQEVGAGGHEHTEACYTKEKYLICEEPEIHLHTHNEDCYETLVDEEGEEYQHLICTQPVVVEHIHGEECFEIVELTQEEIEENIAGEGEENAEPSEEENAEASDTVETEAADNQEETPTYICGKEEHTHSEECYDENGELLCKLEEHTHDDSCVETEEASKGEETEAKELEYTCGKEEHKHSEECYGEEDELLCELEEHTHDDSCVETEEASKEEKEETEVKEAETKEKDTETKEKDTEKTDDKETSDEKAQETEKAKTITKVFESKEFVVTAEYSEDAELPEKAELKAELITADSDKEHYAKREAEYRKNVEDENASMQALLKVGFYLDGKEIEPKSPVSITIQLLDENGLAEGQSITVVHFADDGAEVLDGSKVEDGKTTFETNSFSEFAIGYGTEDSEEEEQDEKKSEEPDAEEEESEKKQEPKTIQVSQDFTYEDDAFHVTFHVEGEAKTTGKKVNQETEEAEEDATEASASDKKETDADSEKEEKSEDKKAEASSEDDKKQETEDTQDTEAQSDKETEDTQDIENQSEQEEGNSEDKKEEEDKAGSEEIDTSKLKLQVEPLEEDSEKYEAILSYTEESKEIDGSVQIRALSYNLTYDGKELDLTECKVTAEVAPKTELVERAIEVAQDETTQMSGIAITVLEIPDKEATPIKELEEMVLSENTKTETMSFGLKESTLALLDTVVTNPKFTVQYYANLKLIDTAPQNETAKAIELIDTSESGNGTGGKLPTNTENPELTHIYVEGGKEKGDRNKVIYKTSLEEIYTKDTYEFATNPNLENFNKYAKDNLNYELKEVWVLREGGNSESKDNTKEDWDIYKNVDLLSFTNNEKAESDTEIFIRDGAVIRLVADSKDANYNNDVLFYDYDVTNGKVYSKASIETPISDWKLGDRSSTDPLYVYTKLSGINDPSNYPTGKNNKFAFGNNNIGGTGLESDKLNGFFINQANADVYGKCSFGIVQNKLDGNGYPVFNVIAPDLFGNTKLTGKTVATTSGSEYSLGFMQTGDTYTLKAVNGSGIDNLDEFQYGGKAWAPTGTPDEDKKDIWTNQFWPMDFSDTWGQDGHDFKFGDLNLQAKRIAIGSEKKVQFSKSDDDKDHNSYFGMTFSVKFQLTADYVGPLNYYFFGDDDMWVFLDGKLVCDIGGVHPSAGEYVDLWDWIEKGNAEEHELKFFYTERGASGSTCWMQFTLPSVNTVPVEYPSGNVKNTLTVSKEVSGTVTDEEFEFVINFLHKEGTNEPLSNYYAYDVYETNENGDEAKVGEGSIKDGDTFKLAANQSIVVRGLPDGSRYTVREKENKNYFSEINGIIEANRTVDGSIDWNRDDEVDFVNVAVEYELPETGGFGTMGYTMTGAVCLVFGTGLVYRKKVRGRRR